MALSSKDQMFKPEWVAGLTDVFGFSYNVGVEVLRPKDGVYNVETNDVEDYEELIFESKARYQPLRTATYKLTVGNTDFSQTARFQFPYKAFKVDFQIGDVVKIVEVTNNQTLLGRAFAIKEFLDSDNEFERSVLVESNQL